MNLTQQIINGLVLGHAYALVAVGWTVLVGVARSVNFAHGQIYMLAAFVAWACTATLGLPYPLAILIAVFAGALVGLLMQHIMMKATLEKNVVSIMIMTLGFGYLLHGAAALIFGSTAQMFDTPLSLRDVDLASVLLTWQDLAIVATAIAVFVGLKMTIDRTALGRIIRMVAEDPALSMLAGIRVRAVYLLVFAFEGAAVALAAGLVAPRTPILTSMGFEEVIMTFVVVVLGGMGSIVGGYLAGLSLGLFTALFGAYVSPAYTTTAAFAVLVAVLVLRPGGLATHSTRQAH